MPESLDALILFFIQDHIRTPVLDAVMVFLSHICDKGLVWILPCVIMMFFPKTRRAGLDILICLAVAWSVNSLVLKPVIARVRPYDALEGLTILVARETSYSLPSGHASSSFAAATAVWLSFKGKGGGWAYLLAVGIAISRVYVGVHYPTDVLAGAAVGALISLIAYKLDKRFIPPGFLTPQ